MYNNEIYLYDMCSIIKELLVIKAHFYCYLLLLLLFINCETCRLVETNTWFCEKSGPLKENVLRTSAECDIDSIWRI